MLHVGKNDEHHGKQLPGIKIDAREVNQEEAKECNSGEGHGMFFWKCQRLLDL